MNKKVIIPIFAAVLLIMAGVVAYLTQSLNEQKTINAEMQELAELDKKEMENEYQQFADQYSEMKTRINNDSLVAQLTKEQLRTQELLKELKQVKSSDAREIARLKKELATCRAVIRSYIIEIDSLNRLNQNLRAENTQIRGQYEEASRQIEGLNTEKASLSEKVAIAAQLDATAINLQMQTNKGKAAKKLKKCRQFLVTFNVAKNVTAQPGNKTVYVQIKTPTGTTLAVAGTTAYENRDIQYSAKRTIEYTGQETPVTLYCQVGEALIAGTYRVSIFCDGSLIGSRSFTLK
ncbi:MAG: hypothetical protein U0K35_08130 [Prevotella sp.]|nr:hypothetical protein [Prevotella sp.]